MGNIRSVLQHNRWLAGVLLLLVCAWFVRLDLLISQEIVLSVLGTDSDQYLSMAADLSGISLPLVGGDIPYESGWIVRVPGYPFLLWLVFFLLPYGVSITSAIIVLHAGLLLISLGCLLRALRGVVPARIVIGAIFLAALLMRSYFFMVLTEWTVFCFLLLFLSATILTYRIRSLAALLILTLVTSLLTLIRPDYVIFFAIVGLIELAWYRLRFKSLCYLAFGLLPVVFWILFNCYRFERFTLAPAEGHIFSFVSLLSDNLAELPVDQRCQLPAAQTKDLRSASVKELSALLTLTPPAILENGAYNLKVVGESLSDSGKRSWLEVNDCLLTISRQIIRAVPVRYMIAFCLSIATLAWSLPLVFVAWLRGRRVRASSEVSFLFWLTLGCHCLHVIFVSAVNIMHLRYYLPTFACVVCAYVLLHCSSGKGSPQHRE